MSSKEIRKQLEPIDEKLTKVLKGFATGVGYCVNTDDGKTTFITWPKGITDVFVTAEGLVIFMLHPTAKMNVVKK